MIRDLSCGDKHVYLSLMVRRVLCWRCGKVKTERLDWLAELPKYTQRFVFMVGRRCHDTPVKAVAEELDLDWPTRDNCAGTANGRDATCSPFSQNN